MALEDVKGLLIGIVVGVILIGVGTFLMFGFFNADNSIDPLNKLDKFNSTMYKAEEISNTVNEMQSNINKITSGSVGPLGWVNALLNAAFGGLQAIGQSLSFVTSSLLGGAAIFGVPLWLAGLVSLIIIIIVAFAIYAAVTRQ